MNNYSSLITILLGFFVITLSNCKPGSAETQLKPNIILIMADDLGYETLGCNGGTSYQTPHLDKLARTGMRFENSYSTPLCTPSRVQIMTGRYNFRNYTEFGYLDPDEKTFGHMLKKAGYATCIAGKWQLGGDEKAPNKAGFDEYCLWNMSDGKSGSRYNDPKILQNGNYLENLEGKYGPDIFGDYVEGFIERNQSKPFFIYYPMVLVHAPFQPTPDSEGYSGSSINKDDTSHFKDMVAYMDKKVGSIMQKLDELNLRENTLVIFTGDNGTHTRIISKMGNRIIHGGKGYTTDAGTHVPMIANWKGKITAGKVNEDLVDFSDFLPTLAEVANTSLPEGVTIDGQSFYPQLQGEKGNPREWIFCHYDPKSESRTNQTLKRYAQDKQWKLYEEGQFYDIKADPKEKNPIRPGQIAGEALIARKKLRGVLDDMHK